MNIITLAEPSEMAAEITQAERTAQLETNPYGKSAGTPQLTVFFVFCFANCKINRVLKAEGDFHSVFHKEDKLPLPQAPTCSPAGLALSRSLPRGMEEVGSRQHAQPDPGTHSAFPTNIK